MKIYYPTTIALVTLTPLAALCGEDPQPIETTAFAMEATPQHLTPPPPQKPSTWSDPAATTTPLSSVATPTSLSPIVTTVQEPNKLELQSIEFTYHKEDHTPLIKLILNTKTKFTLQRLSEKNYVLMIPQACQIGAGASLPYFPPSDFTGVDMLIPQNQDDGVQVKIAVQPGVKITAAAFDREIWITTTAWERKL